MTSPFDVVRRGLDFDTDDDRIMDDRDAASEALDKIEEYVNGFAAGIERLEREISRLDDDLEAMRKANNLWSGK